MKEVKDYGKITAGSEERSQKAEKQKEVGDVIRKISERFQLQLIHYYDMNC